VNNTARISYEVPTGQETLARSANWTFDNGTRTIFDPRVRPANRVLSQLARVAAVLLAVSPMTTGPDPWSDARQQRSQLTLSSTFQTSSRRRITPLEARKMAMDILRRAEDGRAEAAEAEAKQGVDWEDLL